MMNKTTAYILMSGALSSIVIGTYLIYGYFMPESPLRAILWGIALTIIMHLPQLPKSLKVAEGKNLSMARIVIKTTIFGASWWKPLEIGVIDK
ncbi:MAG: hypothetical protein GY737_25395 [Desulfobacteraceae bacterium]|nr:hypothetical protein [Desulfobacteraceae bacterium]